MLAAACASAAKVRQSRVLVGVISSVTARWPAELRLGSRPPALGGNQFVTSRGVRATLKGGGSIHVAIHRSNSQNSLREEMTSHQTDGAWRSGESRKNRRGLGVRNLPTPGFARGKVARCSKWVGETPDPGRHVSQSGQSPGDRSGPSVPAQHLEFQGIWLRTRVHRTGNEVGVQSEARPGSFVARARLLGRAR